MEVRQQPADDAEVEARIDEQIGRPPARPNVSVVRARRRLERPRRRRPDRDNSAALSPCALDCGRRFDADLELLRIEPMILDAIDAASKCSPAVGAATDPRTRAKTVW